MRALFDKAIAFVNGNIKRMGYIAAKRLCRLALFGLLFVSLAWAIRHYGKHIPISIWVTLVSAFIVVLGGYITIYPPGPGEKRKRWSCLIFLALLSIIVVILTWCQTYADDKRTSAMFQELGLLRKAVAEAKAQQSSDMNTLSTVIATNASTLPGVSVSLLDAKEQKLFQEQQRLSQVQKVISESPVDLKTLRADRASKQASAALSRQQADIQKQREEIRI